MTRTDIINFLIKQKKFKSYLEIGLDNGDNFKNIKCDLKESVDPFFKEDHKNGQDLQFDEDIPDEIKEMLTYRMTSDEFFEQNTKTYDIIFIDGLHLQEQVGKDIINSLKILNKNGYIVVHDCLPGNESMQIVPRQQISWNGDVWKAIYELIQQGLDIKVIDTDFGVGIIKYTDNDKLLHYPKKSDITWKDFENNRNEIMNVIDEHTFLNLKF
jgi:hypothetical protein